MYSDKPHNEAEKQQTPGKDVIVVVYAFEDFKVVYDSIDRQTLFNIYKSLA